MKQPVRTAPMTGSRERYWNPSLRVDSRRASVNQVLKKLRIKEEHKHTKERGQCMRNREEENNTMSPPHVLARTFSMTLAHTSHVDAPPSRISNEYVPVSCIEPCPRVRNDIDMARLTCRRCSIVCNAGDDQLYRVHMHLGRSVPNCWVLSFKHNRGFWHVCSAVAAAEGQDEGAGANVNRLDPEARTNESLTDIAATNARKALSKIIPSCPGGLAPSLIDGTTRSSDKLSVSVLATRRAHLSLQHGPWWPLMPRDPQFIHNFFQKKEFDANL
jgi:hypothetical protein